MGQVVVVVVSAEKATIISLRSNVVTSQSQVITRAWVCIVVVHRICSSHKSYYTSHAYMPHSRKRTCGWPFLHSVSWLVAISGKLPLHVCMIVWIEETVCHLAMEVLRMACCGLAKRTSFTEACLDPQRYVRLPFCGFKADDPLLYICCTLDSYLLLVAPSMGCTLHWVQNYCGIHSGGSLYRACLHMFPGTWITEAHFSQELRFI